MERSRIHMLMIACEYTDCIIISQFSVEKAGGGGAGGARQSKEAKCVQGPGCWAGHRSP